MKKEGTKVTSWDGSDIRGVRRELQAKMLLTGYPQSHPHASHIITNVFNVTITERRINKRLEATKEIIASKNKSNSSEATFTDVTYPTATSTSIMDITAHTSNEQSTKRFPALPRLEVLAERLKLDAFEKKMILLLIGTI